MNLLIEMAKKKGGFDSDYGIAKAIGASPQLVSNWQKEKSKPNGLYTAKIMEAGKLETREAIKAMESGYGNIALLGIIAASSLSTLALTTLSYTPSQCLSVITSYCILCKKRIIRKIKQIQKSLYLEAFFT